MYKHSLRNSIEVRNNKTNYKIDESAYWWPYQSLQLLTICVCKDSIQNTRQVHSLAPHWHCCMQDFGCKNGGWAKPVFFSLLHSQFLAGRLFVMPWQCIPSFPEWFYIRTVSLLSQTHLSSQSCFSRILSPLPNSATALLKAMSTFCPLHLDLGHKSVSCSQRLN